MGFQDILISIKNHEPCAFEQCDWHDLAEHIAALEAEIEAWSEHHRAYHDYCAALSVRAALARKGAGP